MRQYYVLNSSPILLQIFDFIRLHELDHEVHLNRTRFWIPHSGSAYTEFVLRFADHCPSVDPTLDLLTGQAKKTAL
jgi:hypothetical protein